jgi:Fe2+ or Zn2+ uptake regulation protein
MSSIEISTFLKKHGIRPSFQRIKIYEYLVNHKTHPTVDTIYKELVNELPTLSKTTVYNTLSLFVENKITQLIFIEDNETRYDADYRTHGHFKCLKCGKIYDFKVETKETIEESLNGFEIKEEHYYIKGICKNCKQN